MIEIAATAFVTLFVIVDPVAVAPIFGALTRDMAPAARRQTAMLAALVAGSTLLVFALFGDYILRVLGISLGAFRIAGGLLLFLLAIEMVFVHQSGLRATTSGEEAEAARRKELWVFPVGIPLLAGPGAMASVVLLMGNVQGSLAGQTVVIAVLLAVIALTLGALLMASGLVGLLGMTGINVLSRIFGIILAALAVQYAIDGIRESFPAVG